MTRDTSIESYKALCDSGKLRGQLLRVLDAVVNHGEGTSAEIIAAQLSGKASANINLTRARFTELAARGLIVETGTRKCKITGRTALAWKYSGRTTPLKPKHRATAKTLRVLLKRALALLVADKYPTDVEETLVSDIRAVL